TEEFAQAMDMEVEASLRARHTFAITQAVKDILVARGADADRISIVPNGVDSSVITPREPDQALRTRLGITQQCVVGYVGTMLEYVGLGLLMEALAQIRSAGADVVALMVGDGAALDSLRMQAHNLGIDDSVIFTGRVPHDEVDDYYSLIDIAPFPRLPLPVTEA